MANIQDLIDNMRTNIEKQDKMINPLSEDSITYIVKENDNIISIAKQFGIRWETIYDNNKKIIRKSVNNLKVGMELLIKPGLEKGYEVKEKDTIQSIAKKHKIKWETLYDNNKDIIGTNPNLVKTGMVLRIR